MAFTAGVKRPQFNSNNNTNKNQNQQSQFDRLVTVKGYNLESKTMIVEDDKGKAYEVYINAEQISRGDESAKKRDVAATQWMGHRIDAAMAKAYPEGSKVILQKTKVIKRDNGNGQALTEANRVVGVPNPEPDKTFQGIFTVVSFVDDNRHQRIGRAQHWKNRGIDINDEEGINKLVEEMNASSQNTGKKIGEHSVTLPTIGVQFRALIKTDRIYELDQTPIYEVVDTSVPFDWIPGPLDEAGKEIKSQAHTITGDEMAEFLNGYAEEHISKHPQFKDKLDDMIIEVCAYRTYPASNNSQLQLTFGEEHRDIHADKNPLYQLSHRKSYVDIDQTEMIQGRNYAVNGIIQLSPNKPVKINGKYEEVQSFWVNNLHANHIKGHVMAMVRTSNGNKAEVHENLKLIVENKKENTNTETQSAAPAASPAPAPRASAPVSAPAPVAAPSADVGLDDDEFDPFASAPAPAPVAAAPAPAPRVAKFGGGSK